MVVSHNMDGCYRAYLHNLPVTLTAPASVLYTADMMNNALLSRILR